MKRFRQCERRKGNINECDLGKQLKEKIVFEKGKK